MKAAIIADLVTFTSAQDDLLMDDFTGATSTVASTGFSATASSSFSSRASAFETVAPEDLYEAAINGVIGGKKWSTQGSGEHQGAEVLLSLLSVA